MTAAVVVDVYTKIFPAGKFSATPEDKAIIVFEIEKLMQDGRPFIVQSRPFKLSLHEKSNLGKFLSSWGIATGSRFDLESLVGRFALVLVKHREGGDGRVFADADLALPFPEGKAPLKPSGHYTRVKDRPAK